VSVLPFLSAPGDSALARELYAGFLNGLRTSPSLHYVTGVEMERQLFDNSVLDVVGTPSGISRFAGQSASTAVIGGVLQRPESGGVELALVVYIQDEQDFSAVENKWFPDEQTALAGSADLGRAVSHPKNLTSADTAFFYSMFLPGAGQISVGRWDHGLFFTGLTAAALFYRASAPKPDWFELKPNDFRSTWNWEDQRYHHFAFGKEVTWTEYEVMLADAQARNSEAKKSRAEAQSWKKRGTVILLGSWLLNIVDALLVSHRNPDTGRFFSLAESVSIEPRPDRITLQVTWPIRP
jgi:hypothetical protein